MAGIDSCHKKLSFELWTFMKAEGSEPDPVAEHVWTNCIRNTGVGLVELITPEA